MLRNELLNLQKERIYPSVTILMPTSRKTMDTNKEKIVLKNLINELEEKLKLKVNKKDAEVILKKVNQLMNEIDFFKLSDGLGIFINEKDSFQIKFPFTVPQTVVIDDTFHTKYLIKQYNRSLEYFLLNLNEKETNLFKGFGDVIEPLATKDFPYAMKDIVELTYDQGTLGFETHQIERIKQYIRETFKRFKRNVDDNQPLIVAGINKLVSLFDELIDYKNIIGKVEGSYGQENLTELGKRANELVDKYLANEKLNVLNQFKESFGYKKGAVGLLDIWNLANQGRIEILLVEESYQQPARFEGNQPVFVNDTGDPYLIEDLVDETIELVFTQKGKVYVFEDGALKDYQRIGAILRY